MLPELIRAAAYADGVLLVEFGDGLRRALTWSDLPFARQTPELDPATARISEDFDAVVVDDAMGSEFDIDGLALRSIADSQTRKAIDDEASTARRRFGERLRMLRKSLSQTQEDLAKGSGIAQPTISRIEAGDREPRLSTLRGYANGLGLSVEQLLAKLDV
jgi:DNA-binding XRE family transcriptional regulator